MAKYIESAQNRLVKRLHGLKLRKNREKEQVFVAEGIRFVGEIPKDWPVECYVVSASYAAEHDITDLEKRAEVYVLTDHLFADAAETENPQGIMAICGRKEYDLAEMLEKKNAFFLMAEEMNDPGNLGTVIRTADAAGAHGVIIPKRRSAGLTAVVAKTSAGAVAHVPVARVANLPSLLKELKEEGVWVFGTAMNGSTSLYQADLKGPAAIVIGSEGDGMTRLAAENCDFLVSIPMRGKLNSLNASAAAAILLYEAVRQRMA